MKSSLLLGLALVAAGTVSACKSTHHHTSSNSTAKSSSSTASTKTSTASTAAGQSTSRSTSSSSTQASSGRSSSTAMTAAGMKTTKLAYPTGDERTSAIVVAKSVPSQVMAGEPFNYMLEVTNVSNLVLDSVTVTETGAANFGMTSSTPKAVSSGASNVWTLESLAPGESRTITVTGSAKSIGNVDNCVSVDYQSGMCTTIAVVKPALDVKVAGPAEVSTCDKICYTYTVTNTGTGAARNAVVRVNLPNGMTTEDGKSTVSQLVGDLREGESKNFQVCVKAGKGSYQMGGTASAEGNLAAESNRVTTNIKEPMLSLTKTGPGEAFVGRKVNYAIVVKNVGDGVAEGVRVVDTLPAGAQFVSASMGKTAAGGKVQWDLGSLQPGQEVKLDLAVKAGQIGNMTNSVECQGTCAPRVSTTAATKVGGIPAILLEVVDLEDPVAVGDQTTYVITVTNQGSADDTNIAIECTVPPNASLISSAGPGAMGAGAVSARTVTFGKYPRLAPKQEIEYRVVVRGDSAADARFRVTMNSDNLTSEAVEETEATNYYE